MLNEETQYVRFVMILWRGDKIIPILYGGGIKHFHGMGGVWKKMYLLDWGGKNIKHLTPDICDPSGINNDYHVNGGD